jgi:RNA polymerase sigma factor (sigma-70 family)
MANGYRNDSEEYTEQAIWLRFRNGDSLAFQSIYKSYFKMLTTYGYRLSMDPQLLEDAIHDVFIDLWRRRAFLSDVNNIRFYLFKALRNKLIRNEKNNVFDNAEDIDGFLDYLVSLSAEQDLVEDEHARVRTQRIQSAIHKLSDRQREVINLRFYNGMGLDEISQLMGLSKQCVSNLLYKSYAVLRARLKEFTTLIVLVSIFNPL